MSLLSIPMAAKVTGDQETRSQPRRTGVRVSSDTSRSALSSRSTGSFVSTGNPSSPSPLAQRLLNHPSNSASPLPPIIPPLGPEDAVNEISRLNDELYDLIALALRGYVSSWYHKLSPRDKEFIPEISTVIIAVIRAVNERVTSADLHRLLLADIPRLLTQHFEDYRLARAKLHTAYASAGSQDSETSVALAHIFHNIQSHLAVAPDGEIDDTYLRQAVDHMLKSCLPPQDWTSEMERSIVREIIVRPVLGNVITKLSQPWFIHSIALALLGSPRPIEPPAPPLPKDAVPPQFRFQHIVIMILTLIQTISTFCLNAIAFFQRSRTLITTVNSQTPSTTLKTSVPIEQGATNMSLDIDEKDYITPLLELVATALTMSERRSSSAILAMVGTASGFATTFFDKLLAHALSTHLLNPTRMSSLITLSKQILFPNGYPGPPPIVPSHPEQIQLRENLERRIRELIPDIIAPYILGPTSSIQRATIREVLEPLSSPACNAHLIMLLFDVVLLTLFPEMGIESIVPESGEGGTGTATDGSNYEVATGDAGDEEASMLPESDDEDVFGTGGTHDISEPDVLPLAVL